MKIPIKLKLDDAHFIARFLHEPQLGQSLKERKRALKVGNEIASQLVDLDEKAMLASSKERTGRKR